MDSTSSPKAWSCGMAWRGLRGFGSIDSMGIGAAELSTASVRNSKTEPPVRSATRPRPANGLDSDGISDVASDKLDQVLGGSTVVMSVRREVHANPVAVRDAADD